jgi:hypothetical protein
MFHETTRCCIPPQLLLPPINTSPTTTNIPLTPRILLGEEYVEICIFTVSDGYILVNWIMRPENKQHMV